MRTLRSRPPTAFGYLCRNHLASDSCMAASSRPHLRRARALVDCIGATGRKMPEQLHGYRLGTASPSPEYKPGDSQAPAWGIGPEDFATIDPKDGQTEPRSIYRFLISAVAPRPIAFVSTRSKDGICNLSPYSFFNVFGFDPPTLVVGCVARPASKNDGMSDTQRNIMETGQCVVHIISDWFVEAANHTCGNYDFEVDEIPLAGLSMLPSVKVSPPRIAESAVHMECELDHLHPVTNEKGEVTATLCILRAVMIHANNEVFDPERGVVKEEKLRPVSRLGGDTYGQIAGVFDLPRPEKDGTPGKLRFT